MTPTIVVTKKYEKIFNPIPVWPETIATAAEKINNSDNMNIKLEVFTSLKISQNSK